MLLALELSCYTHIPDGGRLFVCVCGVSIVIGGLCVGGGQLFPRYMVDQ